MKTFTKSTFITLCLLGTAMTADAQLKVADGGTVYIKDHYNYGRTCANIGEMKSGMTDLGYSSYYTGLRSFAYNTGATGHTIGVFGEAKLSNLSTSYSSAGVWGVGGGAYPGRNMGVAATLHTGTVGAGLYATNQDNAFFLITGSWSGYFYGPIHVEGAIDNPAGLVTLSDMRLKHDVVKVADKEGKTGSTLGNLLGLEVLEYALTTPLQKTIAEMPDSLKPTGKDPNPNNRHFGVSAQELQKIYPELVTEGEDGYLRVNYVELTPLLLRSIQELKAELDEVKGNAATRASRSGATDDDGTAGTGLTAVRNPSLQSCVLYQNTPNPFTAQTEIRFSLPNDAPQAFIYIFDMTGKMQKQIPVDASQQSVTINGYELQAGIYLYSLVVGGQEIDTKRMILSK